MCDILKEVNRTINNVTGGNSVLGAALPFVGPTQLAGVAAEHPGATIGAGAGFVLGGGNPQAVLTGAGIGAGVDASGAASRAADAQVNAANNATALQNDATNRALQFQREQWQAQQAAQAPYQAAGTNALARLQQQLGLTGANSPGVASANSLVARRYMEQNPDVKAAYDRGEFGNRSLEQAAQFHYDTFGKGEHRQLADPVEVTMGPRFNPTGVSPASGFKFNPQGVETTVKGFQFDPSKVTIDPGYSFRLSEGLKGLDRTAAARGGLISGSAIKAATRYGQDMGSQEYQNAFTRAYGAQRDAYDTGVRANDTNYNRAYGSQQDAYSTGIAADKTNYGRYVDKFNADTQQNNTLYGRGRDLVGDQTTDYNRLASLAGIGQVANSQVGNAGQSYANNSGNMLVSNATSAGDFGMRGAQSYGAGQIGGANTILNALNTASSAYGNQQSFNQWLQSRQQYPSGPSTYEST